MAGTPESAVKKRVKAVLDKHGVYYFFPPANGYGRTSIPDIICCVDGKFLAIECKAGTNKPTALQDRELELIRKAGGIAIVVRETNVDDVEVSVLWLKGTLC